MQSPPDEPPSALQTKAEAAEHIAIAASSLARLANRNGLPMVAYLIDMVVLEAWREASEPEHESPGRSLANVDGA